MLNILSLLSDGWIAFERSFSHERSFSRPWCGVCVSCFVSKSIMISNALLKCFKICNKVFSVSPFILIY